MTIAIAVTAMALGVSQGTAQADPLEDAFAMNGGQVAVWEDGRTNGCADGGNPTEDFTAVYPEDLGAPGFDNQAIIVWGNGTDVDSENSTCGYEALLKHWASWGFVVIAPNVAQSGTGEQMRLAAQLTGLLDNFNDPSNVFYQNLDTSSIAAAGHSQGALGAINATLDGNGMFESVLAISTPDREAMEIYNDPECSGIITDFICCEEVFDDCVPVPLPDRVPDMNNLGAPIFFVRGSIDPISNETAADWYPTASVPHAAASRDLIGHIFAPFVTTGYTTAWLGYTLTGNGFGRAAFVGAPPGSLCGGAGTPPEILCNNNWDSDPVTLAFLP